MTATKTDTIRVLVYEPGKPTGEVREIANDLPALQAIVGGYIEAVRLEPFMPLMVICNEEGLLMRLPFNRRGIVGTFFVCREVPPTDPEDGTDFGSLTAGDQRLVRAACDITATNPTAIFRPLR